MILTKSLFVVFNYYLLLPFMTYWFAQSEPNIKTESRPDPTRPNPTRPDQTDRNSLDLSCTDSKLTVSELSLI